MSTDPIEALFERAEQHRIPMYRICERAGVARSTPSRWRNERNGGSTKAIKKLNDALDGLIAEAGTAQAA